MEKTTPRVDIDEEREAYEGHLKWLRMEASTLKKAQQQSREEGKEEGKEEIMKQVVRNMLNQKLADSVIKKMTGFSQEEIDKHKSMSCEVS